MNFMQGVKTTFEVAFYNLTCGYLASNAAAASNLLLPFAKTVKQCNEVFTRFKIKNSRHSFKFSSLCFYNEAGGTRTAKYTTIISKKQKANACYELNALIIHQQQQDIVQHCKMLSSRSIFVLCKLSRCFISLKIENSLD